MIRIRISKYIIYITSLLFLLFCFLGFLIAPNDPMKVNIVNKFAGSSLKYPFGTDEMGRCIFSRILFGGYVTIGITFIALILVAIVGVVTGLLVVSNINKKVILIDSLLNALTAIPPITYLIIFIGIWGNSIPAMIVALTASLIIRMIKLVKTLAEIELSKAYIMCAISSGASRFNILFWHVLPNIVKEIIHFLCISSAEMIMSISGFSFIGLTLGDNIVDWGSMVASSREFVDTNPSLVYYPAIFIFISTLIFINIGKVVRMEESNACATRL